MKRVFLIVLDSCGIGQMPDAEKFGDVGVNTLAACAATGKLNVPNMIKIGLGNIEGVSCLEKTEGNIYVMTSSVFSNEDKVLEELRKL